MKKIILMAALLISFLAISASAQAKVRVTFGKNQFQKKVSGSIGGNNYIDYVFRVERYNFIEAEISSSVKTLVFTVFDTKGKEMTDGVDKRVFSGEADKTGDYRIRVYNRENSNGTKNFRLTISAFMGT